VRQEANNSQPLFRANKPYGPGLDVIELLEPGVRINGENTVFTTIAITTMSLLDRLINNAVDSVI